MVVERGSFRLEGLHEGEVEGIMVPSHSAVFIE